MNTDVKICPKCNTQHKSKGEFCSRKCVSGRPHSIDTSLKKFKQTLMRPWENLGFDTKRALIIVEQKGKCNRCGLSEWYDEILTLEIDHKDGNKNNNSRDNLEGLCPNCHSFTPTWRGRKTKESIRSRRIQDKIKLINILQQ